MTTYNINAAQFAFDDTPDTRPLAELLRDSSIGQTETSETLEGAYRIAQTEHPVAPEYLLSLLQESRTLQAKLTRLASLAEE